MNHWNTGMEMNPMTASITPTTMQVTPVLLQETVIVQTCSLHPGHPNTACVPAFGPNY